ncbi:MAG: peptide chain release factor 1 [Eubacteriales bacterium]|nr:peptide chain release factor 1 [Eubacteriales bacterium]
MIEKLENAALRYDELMHLIAEPDVMNDKERYTAALREQAQLEPLTDLYRRMRALLEERDTLAALARETTDETEKQWLHEEGKRVEAELAAAEESGKLLLLPRGKDDDRNVVMEIRGGAGGDEAALFAADLMKMYLHYAADHELTYEEVDVSQTDLGGVKEAVFVLSGRDAFRRLQFESGVHRVQRVPETEAGGRIHTSTVTVAVLPEAGDIDVTIDPGDLRVDTYRSSGAGGQHVNKTESAIRITHLPTGIVVSCQNERSQIQNRETAMRMLKSKLYDLYRTEAENKMAADRRSQVGTGERSERIRTYNFPQNRVTDHRIGLTLYKLDRFLGGDMDELIEALLLAKYGDGSAEKP